MGPFRLIFILLSIWPNLISGTISPTISARSDLSTLRSLILGKNPNLQEHSWKDLTFSNIYLPGVIPLYAKHKFSFTIPTNLPLNLKYISIESPEFYLKEVPEFKTYDFLSVNIEFYPLVAGNRSSYLIICSETLILVYFMHAICEDSKYKLRSIFQETFLHTSLTIDINFFNPFNKTLEIFGIYSENYNISVTPVSETIAPLKNSVIASMKCNFSELGEHKSSIEIILEQEAYFLPVQIKVISSGLDLKKKINFGIISNPGYIYSYDLFVRNLEKNQISLLNIESSSMFFKIVQEARTVAGLIEKKQIATIKFFPPNEGLFLGTIKIVTKEKSYSIECKALAVFNLLFIPNYRFVFNPDNHVVYNLSITSNVIHDLFIDKVQSSNLLSVSGLSKISAFEQISCKLGVASKMRSIQFLKLSTNIGIIQIPVVIEDPVLKFLQISNGQNKEFFGPIVLGNIMFEAPVSVRLLIENPNKFDVTIELIESIPQSKIEMPKKNTIDALSSIEFGINLKADRNLYHPVTFHTSIGSFFVSIVLNIVIGSCKIKPIYFNDIFPGIPKEQLIYVENQFPIPIKIVEIHSSLETLTVEKTRELVLPHKELVIGKASLLYEKKDKVYIDWNKFLTYADVRNWNQLLHHWAEGEYIGEIKIKTDVSSEIKTSVFATINQPKLSIEVLPRFYCAIGETCEGYLKVFNPLQLPIVVQLLIVPEFIAAEFKHYECFNNKLKHSVDDEFENIGHDFDSMHRKKECLARPSDEFSIIKLATEKQQKNPEEHSQSHSFLNHLYEKYFFHAEINKNKAQDTQKLAGLHESWLSTQAYFVGGKKIEIILSKTSKILGPIYFQPIFPGLHNLSLVLRNNYTLLETINFSAYAGYSKLAFMKRNIYYYGDNEYLLYKSSVRKELHKLSIDITIEEINSFFLSKSKMISPAFFRGFELQNIGNIDTEISGISFEGNSCEKQGYYLNNCNQAFLLKSHESINVQITFKPSLSFISQNVDLWVSTDKGIVSFTVETIFPEDFNFNIFLCTWGEETFILSLSISFASLILLVKKNILDSKQYSRAKSVHDFSETFIQKIFCKKYSQPIFFLQENYEIVQRVSEKKEEVEEVSGNNETVSNVCQVKSRKKTKIKRILTNMVVQKAEELKKHKNSVNLPEIIATNKFLIEGKKKKVKNEELVLNPKENFKINGDSLINSKEYASTTELDDDFFIDSYKTNNILFGGINDRESYGHSDSSQDSDSLNA